MNHVTRNEDRQGGDGWSIPCGIVAVLGFYLGTFVVIAVDELFLKTYWLSNHLPQWVGEVARMIYPFYVLFK
ncbi:MAG: hypothetical protein KDB23_27205 [Planctomycetales bacterium]|nr:hypothetical protein [Planctomycetales bacterium]